MAMVQMNTRVSDSIKKNGDEVFRKLNMNPSEVVRLVWTFAANNKHQPDHVQKILQNFEQSQYQNDVKKKALKDAKKLIADLKFDYKKTKKTPIDKLEGEELRDYLYSEKLKESEW